MVDPSHGGGKFGAPGIGGEGILLGALPGMGYRGALSKTLPMVRKTPFIPQASSGTVFRGTRFGRDSTLNNLRANYARPPGAVRPTRGIIRSALKPKPGSLGYSKKVDYTLRGTPSRLTRRGRPYRPVREGPPVKRGNPLARLWRDNNPWI
jgi:hypothetical protein